jgi:hypothetical protein
VILFTLLSTKPIDYASSLIHESDRLHLHLPQS